MSGIPTQGWRQFLESKLEILSDYDHAKQRDAGKPVKTDHGLVAESAFRRWLESFLPNKYGVCSGYIVSWATNESQPLYHYDVIIYDQLESPVLWVEDNADKSEQGKRRAIPAEHVCGVFEVKSTLTSHTAREALTKLEELRPLLGATNDPTDRYPRFLPNNFCSGVIFFEVLQKNQYGQAALDNLVPATNLRGYFGGAVLRAEGEDPSSTGRLDLMVETKGQQIIGTVAKGKNAQQNSLLRGLPFANSKLVDGEQISLLLFWTTAGFSDFAFDLVARLGGKYRAGFVSSFHAMPFSFPKSS